jgi:2-methylcitrate synthase
MKSEGLAGVIAGKTSISTVGKEGAGLTYRGYAIEDLAEHAEFEEVAYLLLYGQLPNSTQLADYCHKLRASHDLPETIREALEAIPAHAHPMDVMRTGCSLLGNIEQENDFSDQLKAANRLVAALPAMILYWHRFHATGKRIDTSGNETSIAGQILHWLHDAAPHEVHRKALNASLILYAEHEFNASTFAARVIAATGADLHSAITGAIGALRGPLHGGANEAAMRLISRFDTPEEAVLTVREMLGRKEKIMGFGHRVYTESDPRNAINKRLSAMLAAQTGDQRLYPVSEAIERLMWKEKKLFANADFYTASIYHFLGIPTYLFTPMFVCSRITGWCAHVFEQRVDNRLIRPLAEYIGPSPRPWVPIDAR